MSEGARTKNIMSSIQDMSRSDYTCADSESAPKLQASESPSHFVVTMNGMRVLVAS
jgi:hypothetical protein